MLQAIVLYPNMKGLVLSSNGKSFLFLFLSDNKMIVYEIYSFFFSFNLANCVSKQTINDIDRAKVYTTEDNCCFQPCNKSISF